MVLTVNVVRCFRRLQARSILYFVGSLSILLNQHNTPFYSDDFIESLLSFYLFISMTLKSQYFDTVFLCNLQNRRRSFYSETKVIIFVCFCNSDCLSFRPACSKQASSLGVVNCCTSIKQFAEQQP